MDNQTYQFLGRYFLEYVDTNSFKNKVNTELNYNPAEFSVEKAYEDITENAISNKLKLDNILFENILYSDLKNVFIENLEFNPNLDATIFRSRMETFIEHVNFGKLSNDLERYMSPDGFLLMESISTSKLGTFFLAGFDFVANEDGKVKSIRMLFANVVPLTSSPNLGYFLAGLDIDLENKVGLVLLKNISNDIDDKVEEEEEAKWEKSIIKYFNKVRRLVYPILGVRTSISYKNDRKAMFKMCKELEADLLEESRDEMSRRLGDEGDVSVSVDTLLLKLLPRSVVPNREQRDKLIKRFQALLLGTYINTVTDDDGLIEIAKERGLVGFATNISFRSGNASKGATGTSIKDKPIAGEIMFHSLYTDFSESLELPQWSVSWFADYEQTNSTDIEVIPTTIKSTKNYLLLTFKNRNYLNKGLIKHVVNYILKYRNQGT
ncbi:hypothetical protein [Neobacillus mesonae]|uniref:hypothetical protein n=1 Tax=Neobacillus mesonae TaxID=1193713 RepID=UPI00083179FC|nr:hypothetical protein [Neobacillus mesonae]